MKKTISIILTLFVSFVLFAQTGHALLMLRGNVLMERGRYEEALEFYEKALKAADAPADSEAEAKISTCKQKIEERQRKEEERIQAEERQKREEAAKRNRAAEEELMAEDITAESEPVKEASTSLLAEGRFILSGYYYGGKIGDSDLLKDETVTPCAYSLKIYPDEIVIVSISYSDETVSEDADLPITVPFVKKKGGYCLYSNEDYDFALDSKKHVSNEGEYYSLFLIDRERKYVLLSELESERFISSLAGVNDETIISEEAAEPSRTETTSSVNELSPLDIYDMTFYNMDGDSQVIGVSTEGDFTASELCWLVPCCSYIYQAEKSGTYEFDIKVYMPDGTLFILDNEHRKEGYSSNFSLKVTERGSGCFYPFGWGADEPGYFNPGTIKVELWYKDKLILTRNCTIK